MTPSGRVFESSLDRTPYDIRVGAGMVIPGLDEGLKVGGARSMAYGYNHIIIYDVLMICSYAVNVVPGSGNMFRVSM